MDAIFFYELVVDVLRREAAGSKKKIEPEYNVFRDLGMDSLSLFEVVRILERKHQIRITRDELRERPTTIRFLAELVQKKCAGSQRDGLMEIPISHLDFGERFLCPEWGQGIWLHCGYCSAVGHIAAMHIDSGKGQVMSRHRTSVLVYPDRSMFTQGAGI